MTNKQSIAHFSGREQQAIHIIKNAVIEFIKPDLIYFVDSKNKNVTNRSVLKPNIKEENWNVEARLLVIYTPQVSEIEAKEKMIYVSLPDFCKAKLIFLQMEEAIDYVNDYSLFCNWLFKFGLLLYQGSHHYVKTTANISKQQYAAQMYQWLQEYPSLANGLHIKLDPIPSMSSRTTSQKSATARTISFPKGSKISIEI